MIKLYSFFGIMDFYLENFENEDYFNNKTYCIYENFDYQKNNQKKEY